MYPTFASPATAMTIAAMINDEAIGQAERRRNASDARAARETRTRRIASHDVKASKPRTRPAVALLAAAAVVTFVLAAAGWLPAGLHDASKHGPTSKTAKFDNLSATITVEPGTTAKLTKNYP